MTTYLFVTDGEKYDAAGVEYDEGYTWSCSKTTRTGDRALVYLIGTGIQYEWAVTSDAVPVEDWGFRCDVVHIGTFAPPISIAALRENFKRERWAPPHVNFRGMKSIKVPESVAENIRALRGVKW